MRFVQTMLGLGLVLSVAACGGEKKKDEKAAEAQRPSDVPAAAIIRVPVNEAGEPTGEPEMKLSQAEISDVEAAFASGDAPAALRASDELDGDTSTQSWSSPYYGSSYNGGYGSNGGYNQGGYNQGGYNQGGYNQGGYNQGGYNQGGYGYGNGSSIYTSTGSGCYNYSCYGSDYFNKYRPVLYNRGYNKWNYTTYKPYRRGNYYYHCYNSPVYY